MKDIYLSRNDNLYIKYNTTLEDINNVSENFQISKVCFADLFLEKKLLYLFDIKQWTLAEMIFFATNNNICLSIYQHNTLTLLKSYGQCEGVCEGNNDGLISEIADCFISEDNDFIIQEQV